MLLQNGSRCLSTKLAYQLLFRKQLEIHRNLGGLNCCFDKYFCTSLQVSALKKSAGDKNMVQKKSGKSAEDEKTIQVFDQNGLFVRTTKLWKAKSEAIKNNLRLVEMKSIIKSKRKEKSADTEEESDIDTASYKLVSIDDFNEVLTQKKKEKLKKEALKQIIIKSSIDKSGLDLKMVQMKRLLVKKGKFMAQIQDLSKQEVTGQRHDFLKFFNHCIANIYYTCSLLVSNALFWFKITLLRF